MEFWGVEVKAGTPLKVKASGNSYLHLSKASLGEVKKDKGKESILLFLNINGQKLVIGTLSSQNMTQVSYDLVFTSDFELSHNWKNGSVYFCGYRNLIGSDSSTDSDSELEKELPVMKKENMKPEPKNEKTNLTAEKAKVAKGKVKMVEPKKGSNLKEEDDDDSDEDSEEDDGSEESDSEEEAMDVSGEESSGEEDESSSEEDESSGEDTPKKAEQGKKRAAESDTKTPVPEKKAKLVTPQKTGSEGKKVNVHVATPHPSKKVGKTPANNDKPKQESPKSAAQVACKSCSKKFVSEAALQSHTKAKHT